MLLETAVERRRRLHRGYMNKWRAKNRAHVNAYERERQKRKYESDPEYRAAFKAKANKQAMKWYRANIEKARAKGREARRRFILRHHEKVKLTKKAWKFKTLEKRFGPLDHLLRDTCAICERLFGSSGDSRRCLDHDHDTGKARAFLCHRCNSAIGFFDENPAVIRAAADYIESHKKAVA